MNTPATIQRKVNKVLHEYVDSFVVVYIDNILIYSENEKEHVGHVTKILQTLEDANLRVKFEKSEFYTNKIKFLSYNIKPE